MTPLSIARACSDFSACHLLITTPGRARTDQAMFKDFDANAMMYPPGASEPCSTCPLPPLSLAHDVPARWRPSPTTRPLPLSRASHPHPTSCVSGDEPDSEFKRSVAAFTATINQRLSAAHAAEKVCSTVHGDGMAHRHAPTPCPSRPPCAPSPRGSRGCVWPGAWSTWSRCVLSTSSPYVIPISAPI